MSRVRETLGLIAVWGLDRALRGRRAHLIDTSTSRLDYVGEGEIRKIRVVRDVNGGISSVEVVWVSVGRERNETWRLPLDSLYRHKHLGLVLDSGR